MKIHLFKFQYSLIFYNSFLGKIIGATTASAAPVSTALKFQWRLHLKEKRHSRKEMASSQTLSPLIIVRSDVL